MCLDGEQKGIKNTNSFGSSFMIIKKQAKKKKQRSGDVYCVCRHVMNGAMIAYACNEQTGHSSGTILCAECKVKPDCTWHDDTQPQCLDCLARLGIICEDCLKSGIVKVNAARCSNRQRRKPGKPGSERNRVLPGCRGSRRRRRSYELKKKGHYRRYSRKVKRI